MNNKEFYEKLLEYEQAGLLLFMTRIPPARFYRIPIGRKYITLSVDIHDFGNIIEQKIKDNQFFSQQSLERYLDKSVSVTKRLVTEGEYKQIIRSHFKFYIKKDW